MKLQNPFFKSAAQQKVEQHQAAVVAWLTTQAATKVITMAELRAGLPAIAADLSRVVVNQICQNIGAEILDPEDTQA